MVAVKPGDAASFVRRPPKALEVILVYGPDAGLVDERCRALLEPIVHDFDDPFQLVRLDGAGLVAQPERLLDEAASISLFGGRKGIWVNGLDKPIDRCLNLLLQAPPCDNLVVIQAGDLARNSALRALCEHSPRCAALPCYPDGPREQADLVDAVLAEAGLTIEAEARRDLVEALSQDRRQSRAEIEKLALYKGSGAVTSADVADVIVDAQLAAINAVIDAAFTADYAELDAQLSRAFAEKLGADAVLGAGLRHASSLTDGRLKIDGGMSAHQAFKESRVFWKRESTVVRQLTIWNTAGLDDAMVELYAALKHLRRSPQAAESTTRFAFWRVSRLLNTKQAKGRKPAT